MSLIIRNLTKSFAGLLVYKEFSIDFPENKISCIVGPSGCGKTTLLNIISGMIKPNAGELTGFSGKRISYIFQEPRLLPWKTARGNIEFVLKDLCPKIDSRQEAERFIQLVDLEEFADYYPKQLSGGMKQRVAIARAFAYPAPLLLMDEPFKALDPKLKLNLINSFLELWHRDQRTVIFVTHDVEEALLLGQDIHIFSNRPVTIRKTLIQETLPGEIPPESEGFQRRKQELLTLWE